MDCVFVVVVVDVDIVVDDDVASGRKLMLTAGYHVVCAAGGSCQGLARAERRLKQRGWVYVNSLVDMLTRKSVCTFISTLHAHACVSMCVCVRMCVI